MRFSHLLKINAVRRAARIAEEKSPSILAKRLFSSANKNDSQTDSLAPHLHTGIHGETLAAQFLERNNYRLVAANFRIPIGRSRTGATVSGEIDLIGYEGETLCFIEVKTRTRDTFAAPEANVDLRKQRQISRAARAYRRAFGLDSAPYRYDVVAVVLEPQVFNESVERAPVSGHGSATAQEELDARDYPRGAAANAAKPRIELLRNFWTDAKFRKRRWQDAPE